jgi:segregation and condensation protein B
MADERRKTDERAKVLGLDAFRQPPEEAGLALEQLSAALAGMLDTGDDPYAAASAKAIAPVDEALPVEVADAALADDACEVTPRSILEAMLFVGSPGNEPLSAKQVAALMRGVRSAEIDALVCQLNETYLRRNCPYSIVAEGAGYRLQLNESHRRLGDKFYGKARQARLSQAAIEVLATVAYRAPITTEEISRLRGTPSGHIVTQLVRRQLLQLERIDAKPRRVQYTTTPRFLQLFGLNSLADLPQSPDFEGV